MIIDVIVASRNQVTSIVDGEVRATTSGERSGTWGTWMASSGCWKMGAVHCSQGRQIPWWSTLAESPRRGAERNRRGGLGGNRPELQPSPGRAPPCSGNEWGMNGRSHLAWPANVPLFQRGHRSACDVAGRGGTTSRSSRHKRGVKSPPIWPFATPDTSSGPQE